MKSRIPLAQVSIANPCNKDWNAMTGDAKTRFCAGCQKHVHNLSAMTQSEAERVLCESSGRLCVRYEPTADGAVKTLDYAGAGESKYGWKTWTLIAGGVGMLITGAHAMTSQPASPPMLMGDVVCPTPVTPPTTQPGVTATMGKVAAPIPATQPAALIGEPMMGGISPRPATQPAVKGATMGIVAPPTTLPSK